MMTFLVCLYVGFGLVAVQLLMEEWIDRTRARYGRVPVLDRIWSKLKEWVGLIVEALRLVGRGLVDATDRVILWRGPRRRRGRHADTPRWRGGP